jgi:hypothetical protein
MGEGLSDQGRIPFRLRIGVTGHTELQESDELREAVSDAVDLAIYRSGYRKASHPNTLLRLTVVSALAEGADRLVANEVLQRKDFEKSRLICVLPVAEENLEQGEAGYIWAGREVVRNSDVVIAFWDGQASRETGDTAELIHWMHEQDIRCLTSGSSPATCPRSAREVLALPLFGPPALEESVIGAYAPLQIIVETNAGYRLRVDDEPPYELAASAARKQVEGDLERLDEFNSESYPDMDRSAAPTVDLLAPAQYRDAWPRLSGIVEQIGPCLNRAGQASMAAQRDFKWSSYRLFAATALATIIAALQAFYLLAVGCAPETEFDIGGTEKEPGQHDWVRRAFMAVLAEGDIRQQTLAEDPETLSSLIRGHWIAGQHRSDYASDADHLHGLTIEVDDLLTDELTRWLDEVSGKSLEVHG